MKKFTISVLVVAVAAGAYSWFFVFSDTKDAPAPARRGGPVPVVVAPVQVRTVPVTVETIGSIEPLATVSVKSRVDGQMMESFIREGQLVSKGAPLFTIDPRPFRAKVAEMEANLAKDRAQLANARADLSRYAQLAQGGFSSAQKYDLAKVATAVLEAAVQVDLAQLDRAKLDLEFTSIRAPVDGRLGSVLVNPGNLVKANDGAALVVINQIRPINVGFSVPERLLPEIKTRIAEGGLVVDIQVPGARTPGGGPLTRGRVVFVNNAVDAATGTIQLKAELANEAEQLTPGQFVRVSLILHELANARIVPAQAIQNGQVGTFVYRVRPDKRVAIAPVKLGPPWNGNIVIEDGLDPGDIVVTEGQLRLRPGAAVSVSAGSDAPAAGKRPGGGKRDGGGKPGAPGKAGPGGKDGPSSNDSGAKPGKSGVASSEKGAGGKAAVSAE